MPIYMDRHDIPGVTALDVAEAHVKDLEIQDQYGVNLMTYWFDQARGTVFCLMEAPSEDHVRELHRNAHGLVPHEVIEVDPAIVGAFLGRIEDPPKEADEPDDGSKIDSAFRAIMFTDIVGSTDMTVRLGDEEAVRLISDHNSIVRKTLRSNNGSEIKFTGDGFHASFSLVSEAVRCAICIQQEFATYNEDHPDREIRIKIGLSAGEPIMADQDLFGSTVNLAARICEHAAAEQILVAQVVCDLCLGKKFDFNQQSGTLLKGFDEPTRLSEVAWSA